MQKTKRKRQAETIHWNRPFWALCCLLQVIYGVLAMCFAVVLNTVATTASTAADVGELVTLGVGALLFGVVYPASRALADSTTAAYAEKASQAVRGRLNRAIFSMDSAEFSRRDTGEYLNHMTGDVQLVRDQYYWQVPMLFGYVARFVFCVIYSIVLNPMVALVLMVMSVIQYVVPMLLGSRLNRYTTRQSQETASFTSKAKELLLGFSVVKSYGGELEIQQEFDGAGKRLEKARTETAVQSQLLMCTNLLIAILMILLSVLTAGYFVIQGSMQPASLLTVFYIANCYSAPLMDFANAYTQVKGSKGVRDRLTAILRAHPETPAAAPKPVTSGITVQNLSFSYPGGENGEKPVLRDISCRFEAGKKYLLVGESGCGKSTLLRLLARQYPSHGVSVDGVPLEALPEGALAGQVVLVGQQPYLFRRSIGANIDFLGTGDRARLAECAEQCCLSDLLASLPEGLDTMVDEEQRQLSGGQKARIGLARALYTRPGVLLLDEVTSALDAETARRIEELVLELPDTLVIHISHKPSADLTARYDAVLTLDGGRLVRVEEKAAV